MKLWIRADASRKVGLGHVMRMVAIAEEAMRRSWQVVFITYDPDGLSAPLLTKHGLCAEVLSSPADRSWAGLVTSNDAVMFDGYDFGVDDHTSVRHAACVSAMDDFGQGQFDVKLLVIPEPLEQTNYLTPPGAQVRIGPSFAPIRQEFLGKRRLRNTNGRTLLITAGGTDATGLMDRILQVAGSSRHFDQKIVLLGPGVASPQVDTSIVTLVRDPLSVAEVFDRADAAISAAGSSAWELMCLGIPTGLIQVTDNQALIISGAQKQGAAISLGDPARALEELPGALSLLADQGFRVEMSRRAMGLIDGLGAARILEAMADIALSAR